MTSFICPRVLAQGIRVPTVGRSVLTPATSRACSSRCNGVCSARHHRAAQSRTFGGAAQMERSFSDRESNVDPPATVTVDLEQRKTSIDIDDGGITNISGSATSSSTSAGGFSSGDVQDAAHSNPYAPLRKLFAGLSPSLTRAFQFDRISAPMREAVSRRRRDPSFQSNTTSSSMSVGNDVGCAGCPSAGINGGCNAGHNSSSTCGSSPETKNSQQSSGGDFTGDVDDNVDDSDIKQRNAAWDSAALDRAAATSMATIDVPPWVFDKIFRLLKDFGHKKDLERYGRYIMQVIRSRSSAEVPRVLSSRFLPEHDGGQSPVDRVSRDPVYIAAMQGRDIADDEAAGGGAGPAGGDKDWAKRSGPAARHNATTGESSDGNADDLLESKLPKSSREPVGPTAGADGRKQEVNTARMAYLSRLARAHAEDNRHKLYQMTWSPEAALAYLAHRYPPTYAANLRVFAEIKKRCPDFVPRTMLDYGAGPAPSVAAAFECWNPDDVEKNHKDEHLASRYPRAAETTRGNAWERVLAVEPSAHMSQMGQYLLSDPVCPVEWQAGLYELDGGPNGKHAFDLVTMSYVQMEIRGQPSRDMLIRNLWNRVRPGGTSVSSRHRIQINPGESRWPGESVCLVLL